MVINDAEKQQILTFKWLNQQFFLLIYMKNDTTINQLSKQVTINSMLTD